MKINLSFIFGLLLITINTSLCLGQFLTRQIAPTDNFYTLRNAYLQGWQGQPPNDEGGEFNQFMRWSNFWSPRIAPSGNFQYVAGVIKDYVDNYNISNKNSTIISNWAEIGPAQNNIEGIGQIKAIAFDPVDPANIIYVGAPNGGVFKTIDGGLNWFNLNTDQQLARLGVSCIEIDPYANSGGFHNIYISTGDYLSFNSFSDGVYRSEDGGSTWHTINNNLFNAQTGFNCIPNILIDPSNTTIMYAATSIGIYRTLNRSAASPIWQKVYPLVGDEFVRNIKFEPGNLNYNVLYASGVNIVKSDLHGDQGSWTSIALNGSGLELAGTPNFTQNFTHPNFPGQYIQTINFDISADNVYLYALIVTRDQEPPMMYDDQVYQYNFRYEISTGVWTLKSPLYLYRQPIAVAPFNNQIVYSGDVSVCVTVDGGDFWDGLINGCAHPDIHVIKFSPADPHIFYSGGDGGFNKYEINSAGEVQNCWELNNGLGVALLYASASSLFDPYQILIGNQDNGITYFKDNTWTHKITSDGMACLMDYENEDVMYAQTYQFHNGTVHRSQPPTGDAESPSFDVIFKEDLANSESAIFLTPIVMSNVDSKIIYQGRHNVWKTTDATAANTVWNPISSFISEQGAYGNQVVNAIAVAPLNEHVIYASLNEDLWAIGQPGNTYRLFKTTTGGGPNNWIDLTPNLQGQTNSPISSIAVSTLDPNHVWITYSGYISGDKVEESFDGGTTWTKVNTGLPNLPINCIIYEKGSDDGIYIGTDVGVYFKNSGMPSWQPFMVDLPNVVVSQLEINYSVNKIRAATYGRGLWESDLACPPPLTLSGNITSGFYEGDELVITDVTVNSGETVHFRGSRSININTNNGSTNLDEGSLCHLFIHGCDLPGNSWRVSPTRIQYPEFADESEKHTQVAISKTDFSIIPNPNNGKFSVFVPAQWDDELNLEIYDITGNLIYFSRISFSSDKEFDFSTYSNGLYIARIHGKENISHCKFQIFH